MTRTTINHKRFSLFYDYDKCKLSKLNLDEKIEWFHQRSKLIFLNPIDKMFNSTSKTYKELEKPDAPYPNFSILMLIAISLLLNGIEAFGAFTTKQKYKARGFNKNNFDTFFIKYLPQWNIEVKNKVGSYKKLVDILWYYYRNALTHGLRIEYGGIDKSKTQNKFFIDTDNIFQINYPVLYLDFNKSIKIFFKDLKNKSNTTLRTNFEKRFIEFYPH